jgi:hypothetical protein
VPSDRFSQYSEDEPTTTLGSYDWTVPTHPQRGQTPRRVAVMWSAGGAARAGGGGGDATTANKEKKRLGDQFEAQWRAQ